MTLLALSFVAGVLTVAAPCILPLLPIIIGGAIVESAKDSVQRQWVRPLIITASLVVSVVAFSLLIKATTLLLDVPQEVWQAVSGLLVASLGLYYVWPNGWEKLAVALGIQARSNQTLGKASRQKGVLGAIALGAALGPVFSSCSPTYALIVAAILPASFAEGLAYLVVYAVGMGATLLFIAYIGQGFVMKLRWLSDPNGWFKRLVGALFIIVGLLVFFGLDKKVQTFVLDQGWYAPISNLEESLRR
ncbi:MAG TPA: cytochrome c biogenesis protein CcdA [Candidatus Saccharimonadales bacterium]|nr:cytochrome c biogenesis protein CcdA [Candidatus Saccharimonadales bacterium]